MEACSSLNQVKLVEAEPLHAPPIEKGQGITFQLSLLRKVIIVAPSDLRREEGGEVAMASAFLLVFSLLPEGSKERMTMTPQPFSAWKANSFWRSGGAYSLSPHRTFRGKKVRGDRYIIPSLLGVRGLFYLVAFEVGGGRAMPPSLGEETEEVGHPPFSSCRVDLFFVMSRSVIVVTPIYFRREARKEVTVASSPLFLRRGGLYYFYTLKMVVNEPPHLLPTEEEQRVTIHPPLL